MCSSKHQKNFCKIQPAAVTVKTVSWFSWLWRVIKPNNKIYLLQHLGEKVQQLTQHHNLNSLCNTSTGIFVYVKDTLYIWSEIYSEVAKKREL